MTDMNKYLSLLWNCRVHTLLDCGYFGFPSSSHYGNFYFLLGFCVLFGALYHACRALNFQGHLWPIRVNFLVFYAQASSGVNQSTQQGLDFKTTMCTTSDHIRIFLCSGDVELNPGLNQI